jgi:hypothetical protein
MPLKINISGWWPHITNASRSQVLNPEITERREGGAPTCPAGFGFDCVTIFFRVSERVDLINDGADMPWPEVLSVRERTLVLKDPDRTPVDSAVTSHTSDRAAAFEFIEKGASRYDATVIAGRPDRHDGSRTAGTSSRVDQGLGQTPKNSAPNLL